MRHFHSLADVHLEDVWLTIGSFDGIHKGHQKILRHLTAGAQKAGVPAVVLTFFPHPAAILRGQNYPYYLSSPEEKTQILAELGIDVMITHPFNRDVADMTARNFILSLFNHMTIRHLQVGHDFAMGKNRDGNFEALKSLGRELGYTTGQTPPVEIDENLVSSSRIRFLLGAGQIEEVTRLLGRNYPVHGLVEMGDQRGRKLGFPTANLSIWAERIIPTAGVYACTATVRGKTWGAVTNIGVRPTFESRPVAPRVESHILDFDKDIYGETVHLEFISRLRAERKFPSIDELVAQIREDTTQARQILSA